MNFIQQTTSMLVIAFLLMPALQVMAQTESDEHYNMSTIQPKGNEVSGGNFTGTVWVNMIVEPEDNLNTVAGKVMFEPKARTNWHSHAGGQILIVTDGVGYYQEEGKPIKIIREGDVIKAPANVPHWHGGSPEQSMTHTAIVPDLDEGRTSWADPVTDKEYEMADGS
ncbi:cupin domain-containing protein [Aliifodinibius sp. S!AR15-10]|uniref:cupin domain-containing protein n=1 Tax=Aliifodinibius sp. S!AR15-10 TaxID=2950437 RepID=UPI002855D330|nr:cupin domain-containing protein [Aliifodinibius sp. S!AR15-10]MDR8392646.1 cupin domain-containing protein [Aliifodinibius sp. S!AR15-10]